MFAGGWNSMLFALIVLVLLLQPDELVKTRPLLGGKLFAKLLPGVL